MYENAQAEIDRILTLVKTCPQDLQARCFEILLGGYVESQLPRAPEARPLERGVQTGQPRQGDEAGSGEGAIPPEIRGRLSSLAKRSGVTVNHVVGLFDFTIDPFTFGAFALEGKNQQKARKAALLVAAKNYLVTGKWSADWDEIKAVCSDHGCYDVGNFSKTMREAKPSHFKAVNVGDSVDLSTSGITKTHELVAEMTKNAAKQ